MLDVLTKPPFAQVDPVSETLHGVSVADPYRWLEDPDSPRTREWLAAQHVFARRYLDTISRRNAIRDRVRDFLQITTYDSFLMCCGSHFFRKRLPGQEQPCICMREGAEGHDQLLIDPDNVDCTHFTAVTPLAVSPDRRFLAYSLRIGGERSCSVKLFDISNRRTLPDELPRAHLRGFGFSPDVRGFYYTLDPIDSPHSIDAGIYYHALGTRPSDDILVFPVGQSRDIRVALLAGPQQLLSWTYALGSKTTNWYILKHKGHAVRPVLERFDDRLAPQFAGERLFALTDHNAPNSTIVELAIAADSRFHLKQLIPGRKSSIRAWRTLREHIVVCYQENTSFSIVIFDFSGNVVDTLPIPADVTVRLEAADFHREEVIFQQESFFHSVGTWIYSLNSRRLSEWAGPALSLDTEVYAAKKVSYASADGTTIPIVLVGRRDTLDRKDNPAILTSYGGFAHAMTPQFSVFVSVLLERGCVFAMPGIRGGNEFGAAWHEAAQRRKRQTAFDDFICSARWLLSSRVAAQNKIAIFGGSNSGLLVGVAMTQAPGLFRAVLCIAPLLDMVRYHHFNDAIKWHQEFGTADDPQDFAALWAYSPYHRIRDDTAYPAVMMVSGDSDQKCNPLHARKMVARLQAASASQLPIILDYSSHRGHTPVLPLTVRIDALADRIAFICDQLEL